ncbi:uncharacterized protein [Paramormyrops kingsleyae]|uniref:uncharacterized protein isoform X1 n=2 Tax=Paramormyrops kingsleyae TaxID=1676925 RepID=UPI003B97C1B3
MESAVLARDSRSLPYEKQLQVHQYTLSKGMSPRLLELIFSCLSSTETLTNYEGQVIRSQPTDLQKTACFMQTLIRKGRRACRLFYEALESLDPSLFEQVTGVQAKCPIVATPCPLQDRTLPNEQSNAPTYVVNIQNSTLVNCIIGSKNDQYINSDQQGQLLQSFMESRQDVAAGNECVCCQMGAAQTAASSTDLQVHGSNLEYVIIGDKNSLTVEEGEETSDPEE